jgi:hypothetical protein
MVILGGAGRRTKGHRRSFSGIALARRGSSRRRMVARASTQRPDFSSTCKWSELEPVVGFDPESGGVMQEHESHVVLDEHSSASCPVTSWQERVHLAWTGSDFRLNTISLLDGRFEDKRTLPERSYKTVWRSSGSTASVSDTTRETVPLPPALVATTDGLCLAWTGGDSRLNVLGPGHRDSDHVVLDETSSESPALATWENELVLAWTGTDRHLNLVYARNGEWGRPIRLDETSSYAPAICEIGTKLVLSWTGTDRHLNLLYAENREFGSPVRLTETSSDAPALGAVGDDLVLGWTGTDRHLNLLRLLPVGAEPVRLDETSSCSPGLCRHVDLLVVTWTGTDRHPNIARRAV